MDPTTMPWHTKWLCLHYQAPKIVVYGISCYNKQLKSTKEENIRRDGGQLKQQQATIGG